MEEVIVRLMDDLDPTQEARHVVIFGVNGRWRRIDLTAEHKERLEGLLEPFVKASRPAAEAETKPPQRTSRPAAGSNSATIWDWARRQTPPLPVQSPKRRGKGFEVPYETRLAYEQAHPKERKVS